MERRLHARRNPVPGDPLARVRLRAGPELSVVNVSDAGALVEGTTRLLPGTRVDVHLIARAGRVLARSRVSRAYVCLVQADRIGYRAGIAFDVPVDTRPPVDSPVYASNERAEAARDA